MAKYYQPIWDELKTKKKSIITVEASYHRTVKKAVINLKWADTQVWKEYRIHVSSRKNPTSGKDELVLELKRYLSATMLRNLMS